MSNRVITVPKDKAAEKLLNYDAATPEQLIELNITKENFIFLYKKQIISLINHIGKINIDDYEDDCISDKEKISIIISELNAIKVTVSESNSLLLEKIIKLFEEAISRNTGVYFFF